jgi:hypothetical protein
MRTIIAILFLLTLSSLTNAADYRQITYQGRILRPDTSAVTGSVQFRFRITDGNGTCILWEESQTQTLTDGAFSLVIGSNTPTYDGTSSNNITNIFKQGAAINCQGGTPSVSVTPASTDDRNVTLSYNDGTGWITLPAQLPLKAVPYALTAENANRVGGVSIASTAPANGQILVYNSGSSTWEPQNLTAGGTITSVVAGTGLTGGATSGAATLNVNLNAVLPTQTGNAGKILATDGSGNLTWVTDTGVFPAIANNTIMANTSGSAAAPIATTLNTILNTITTTQGSILYRNSTGWVALTPGTTGYFLRTNGTGMNPTWAAGGGLTAVSNTATLANGRIWIGDGTNLAQEQTLSQDVSVTNTGVATINRIQNRLVDSTAVTGGVFVYDTTTTTWKGKAFPSCTTAQTAYYNSIADAIQCQSIGSLSGSVITSGVVSATYLPAASSIASGIVNQIAQSFSGLKTFLSGIAVTGDVDVTGQGKFDTVQVAASTATCNAGYEGALRYNSTTKRMEFCNGTLWANMSTGIVSTVSIGSPSSSLVKSGPVTFLVTYGSGTDTATITLATGNITLGGTATAGCSVTGVAVTTASTRTVTVNGCTGTGTVNISIAAGTGSSTTTEPSQAAGPSTSYNVDNTGPNAPTGITLGSVPSNLTSTPTISYTAPSDVGGSTVASHQVQIIRTSDSSVISAWATHTSGNAVTGLTLAANTGYSVLVRAVDALGNNGAASTASNWTSINQITTPWTLANFSAGTPGTFSWSSNGFSMSSTFSGNYFSSFWNPTDAMSNTFTFTFRHVVANNVNGAYFMGMFNATQMAGLSTTSALYTAGPIGIYTWDGNLVVYENGSASPTYSISAGDTVSVKRNSSNQFEVYRNSTLVHTSTITNSDPLYTGFGGAWNSLAVVSRVMQVDGIIMTYP